jgi:hypothetical protein
MIQQAFKPKWWNTTKSVRLANGKSYSMTAGQHVAVLGPLGDALRATLVSIRTPIDQYLRYPLRRRWAFPIPRCSIQSSRSCRATCPDSRATRSCRGSRCSSCRRRPRLAPNGLGCAACHVGAELTSASARNLTSVGAEAGDIHFVNAGFDQRMERMFLQLPPCRLGTSSVTLNPSDYTMTAATPSGQQPGWRWHLTTPGNYNVGVRPTSDNPGLDGVDPFGTTACRSSSC